VHSIICIPRLVPARSGTLTVGKVTLTLCTFMNIEPASRLMLLRGVEVIWRVKIEAFTKSSWLYRDKAGMFELLPTAARILLQRLVNFVVIVKAPMACLVVHWNKMQCLDGLH
jgi:hypothetical protein